MIQTKEITALAYRPIWGCLVLDSPRTHHIQRATGLRGPAIPPNNRHKRPCWRDKAAYQKKKSVWGCKLEPAKAIETPLVTAESWDTQLGSLTDGRQPLSLFKRAGFVKSGGSKILALTKQDWSCSRGERCKVIPPRRSVQKVRTWDEGALLSTFQVVSGGSTVMELNQLLCKEGETASWWDVGQVTSKMFCISYY